MGIEAVVFDWGGVLAGVVSRDLAEVEQRLGVPAGSLPELMGMHPCDTDLDNLWHLRELGRATALEWAQWYADRLRAAGGAPVFTPEQMVATEALRFSLPQNLVVLDVVRRLHLEGYKLAICTNNFTELGEVWRAELPLDLFDAVVASCEIGYRKPDAEMFNHVTDRLGVDPGSVVLVDDFEANVDGARRAGWHGILVGSDHGAAMSALAALLAEHPSAGRTTDHSDGDEGRRRGKLVQQPHRRGKLMRPQRRGAALAMDDARREELLSGQRTCRVATVGAGGQPHTTAMWFVWDGRSIWLNSLSRTQRWTDLGRDPRVSVLVDGGEEFLELYGIEIIGTAAVVGEVPRTGEPVDELLEPERLFGDKYANGEFRYDGRHAWLRVDPEKIVSWDFSNIARPS